MSTRKCSWYSFMLEVQEEDPTKRSWKITQLVKTFIVFTWHLISLAWLNYRVMRSVGNTSWPEMWEFHENCVSRVLRYKILLGRPWYRDADRSLARPGRKEAYVSVRMAWISFGVLPCRKKKKNLTTARVPMSLKSRASLTCFRACFLPGRAEDLSAPR